MNRQESAVLNMAKCIRTQTLLLLERIDLLDFDDGATDCEQLREQAEALRDALRAQGLNVHLIGRATKTKIELDQDYIDERLPVAGKEMIYRQVENSFTQPNAAMNIQML